MGRYETEFCFLLSSPNSLFLSPNHILADKPQLLKAFVYLSVCLCLFLASLSEIGTSQCGLSYWLLCALALLWSGESTEMKTGTVRAHEIHNHNTSVCLTFMLSNASTTTRKWFGGKSGTPSQLKLSVLQPHRSSSSTAFDIATPDSMSLTSGFGVYSLKYYIFLTNGELTLTVKVNVLHFTVFPLLWYQVCRASFHHSGPVTHACVYNNWINAGACFSPN